MGRPIRANYEQSYLFPPSVNDWVPADHPARFIRDFVDALDLKDLGFAMPEGLDGRPAYACDLLLKAWLHGYYHKIRSSRGLEKACYDSISLVWLTGNEHPDHNTLWRFWRTNRSALKGVFRSSVKVAVKNEMVSLALQAVDGTKIAAQVSTARAVHRKELEKYLARIDEAIEEVMGQVEGAEGRESGSYRLPPEMADAQKRREQIRRTLDELAKADCAHRHPRDPEAKVMRCREGERLGYNAQAVSEANHRLIVASEVTDEANDYAQLTPMLQAAKETVGHTAQETLADSGYCCGEQLALAERQKAPVLVTIPVPSKGRHSAYPKSAFTYDRERDVYVCPRGEALCFERTRKWRGKHVSRVYRCTNCSCASRGECTRDPKGRTVEQEPFYEAVERQRQKQTTAKNCALLRKRKEIAELPFARLKHLLGFRRWTVRGLENVRAQWALLCATLNLGVLYGWWKQGKLEMT